MNKKYLGHPGGLIGPIEKTFGRPDYWNTESEKEHNEVYEAWQNYLASLPPIPCEGWKPEVGAELVEGVHFRRDELITLEGGKEISRRIVAVPLPAAPEDILTPEELGAYVQDAVSDIPKRHKTPPFAPTAAQQEGKKTYDPFVQKHLSRIKLGLASVGASSVFIPCMPQDQGAFNLPNTNTWLREIKFDSIEASPTYPAEFVEWAVDNAIYLGYSNWRHRRLVYTTPELFTGPYQEWKRIKEQSK